MYRLPPDTPKRRTSNPGAFGSTIAHAILECLILVVACVDAIGQQNRQDLLYLDMACITSITTQLRRQINPCDQKLGMITAKSQTRKSDNLNRLGNITYVRGQSGCRESERRLKINFDNL